MFPPKTGGSVHAKRGGSRSMQQGGLVHAKPRSLICADFEYVFTIPTSMVGHLFQNLRSFLSVTKVFHLEMK